MKSITKILSLNVMFILINVFISSNTSAQEYFEVKVSNGDGVLSILRKYDLLDYSCNYNKFLELNSIKRESNLILGKNYKLPLMVYKYNGSSIRSTLNISDMDQAIKIRDYNNRLYEKKIVSKKFEKSTELLVPFSVLNCKNDKNEEKNGKNVSEEKVNQEKGNKKDTAKQASEDEKKSDRERENGKTGSFQLFKQPNSNGLNRYVPLFGQKLATVPIEDNRLENRVFYILTGHGGPDPGAICTESEPMLCEDEYAYDVSLRLARNLMQHGATVHIIVQDENDGIREDRYLPCDSDEKTIDGLKNSNQPKEASETANK